MINRYDVSNDPSCYEAWPDLALTKSQTLICVITECTSHGHRPFSCITYTKSTDRGVTWSPKRRLTASIHGDGSIFWDCPRISALSDGRLAIVCTKVNTKDELHGENYLWYGDAEGENWDEPILLPADGIVPDKLLELKSGRLIFSCHLGRIDWLDNLQQRLWYSDDKGISWQGPVTIARDDRYQLCEGSILEVEPNKLVCFMRENSGNGLECFASRSEDGGMNWSELYTIPLSGCHRPVSGFLDTGEIMITYRYRQGARKQGAGLAAQNTFLAITDAQSVLSPDKAEQWVRIMPLNYDHSKDADLGYTGWVQFPDSMIYIVDYIRGDEESCHIVGASLYRADIGGGL